MIRIFQRHCNFSSNSANKERPEWFDREKIFDSLINTLDNRVEYTAFHDCGNGDIKDHFLKILLQETRFGNLACITHKNLRTILN